MKITDTVLGAFIALAGVLLTQLFVLLADWLRAIRERRNAQRQRELSLKRDIYLPLVHALTEGLDLFVRIPPAHHSKIGDLRLSIASQNALAEKDLIASESVMATVQIAAKQFLGGTTRLMLLKMDEVKLAMDLDRVSTRIDELNAASRLIVDRVNALREAGSWSAEKATAFDSQFQLAQSELGNLFSEQRDKLERRATLLKELHIQMMKEVDELSAVSVRAVVEIRRDLDIPTNAEAILAQYQDSQGLMRESGRAFIEETWRKATGKTD